MEFLFYLIRKRDRGGRERFRRMSRIQLGGSEKLSFSELSSLRSLFFLDYELALTE